MKDVETMSAVLGGSAGDKMIIVRKRERKKEGEKNSKIGDEAEEESVAADWL